MTNRILEFSQAPARLSYKNGLLAVNQGDNPEITIPLTDICAIVLAHPQISISAPLLGQLGAENVALICCDAKMRPSAMMLPLEGMHTQSNRFRAQASMSQPRKKQAWQQIVRAKIASQARVLEEFHASDFGLSGYAKRVQSGDKGNVEAHAARRYWCALWEAKSGFRRSNDEDVRNHLLNYGYAVLRAIVARSLCACGLHPGFELHHHNVFNTFPLADDLMEPFRPAVDRVAFGIEAALLDGEELVLNSPQKRQLLGLFTARYRVEDESRTMIDLVQRAAQSLARYVLEEEDKLFIPAWNSEPKDSAEIPRKANASSALQDHVAIRNVRSAG